MIGGNENWEEWYNNENDFFNLVSLLHIVIKEKYFSLSRKKNWQIYIFG